VVHEGNATRLVRGFVMQLSRREKFSEICQLIEFGFEREFVAFCSTVSIVALRCIKIDHISKQVFGFLNKILQTISQTTTLQATVRSIFPRKNRSTNQIKIYWLLSRLTRAVILIQLSFRKKRRVAHKTRESINAADNTIKPI
jgi:hypothetical protein